TGERRSLFRRARNRHERPRLQLALHVEPPEQRREIERCPTPSLERATSRTEADEPFERHETDSRILRNPAERRRRAAPPQSFSLDENHLETGGAKCVGGGAPGQATANHDH